MEDGEEWTLERIKGELGISRERVRQIINAALRRLKARSDIESLREFLG